MEPGFATPDPVVGPADATFAHPAGSAAPGAIPLEVEAPVDPHPEYKVGGAFAGGLLTALVLTSLAKRRHR